MPETRIGISGWTYAPWRGTFYPPKLRQRDELAHASRQLNSIEINGTFYSLQRPESFRQWHDATPDDFVFAVKGPRYITHMKRLKNVEKPLANFFASGLLRLKQKLGPILWQFPPNFVYDESRLEAFFELLPRTFKQAATLAKGRDDWMKERSYVRADADRPIRYTIEVRHDSFDTPAFLKLLRRQQIALCIADSAGRYPMLQAVTADFVYARLHGNEELYVSGYDEKSLDEWAKRLRKWRTGPPGGGTKSATGSQRDLFVYFDNDVKVRSPLDAASLARRFGVEIPDDSAARDRLQIAKPKLGPARQSWPSPRRKAKAPRRAAAAKSRRSRTVQAGTAKAATP